MDYAKTAKTRCPWDLHPVMARGIEGTKIFRADPLGKMGYPGAEVAGFLGVTTSAVIRAAYSEELPEIQRICKFIQMSSFQTQVLIWFTDPLGDIKINK